MAGYSGTPLPKKLGIKAEHRIALIDAPKTFAATLRDLPEGATVHTGMPATGSVDVVVWFVSKRADFERRLSQIRKQIAPAAGL